MRSPDAVGILSLLDEPENELKVYSLTQLDSMVDHFWAEIADHISKMYDQMTII